VEYSGILKEVVILLATAVIVVALFKRLHLSPVLGYLVAGTLIGQNGFGFIDSSDLEIFAKLGVVFLLFAIGLELTIDRLMVMRWHVFGFGSLQVLITSAVIGTVCFAVGLSVEASIVIGGALSLSSTAVVLRVIADNSAQSTQVGRISLANLLLQDFAVVPLLVLVPLLAKSGGDVGTALATATVKAFVAMLVIFFLGRMLLRPLFRLIASAKSNELFIATTLLVVLGVSMITEYLGLSLALGAFIAGLLVAETQYQHQVEDSIMPFKDLLLGLFFMTVGMSINIVAIYEQLDLIAALSMALIFVKAIIIFILCRLFHFPRGSALHAGLLLSQGGEFAFILFALAAGPGLEIIDTNTAQLLLLVVTVTMALTPALSLLGKWLNQRIETKTSHLNETFVESSKLTDDLSNHVVIIGFGKVGEMVARMLTDQKVHYVALDSDIKRVKEMSKRGFSIFHADPTKIESLERVGAHRAKTIIITIREQSSLKKVISVMRKSHPEVPIVVRTEDLRHSHSLRTLGATEIVPEKYEAALQLAGALLRAIGVSEFEVSRVKNQYRAANYERIRDALPPEGM
jgi:CPA2 family monovalent cation:H+ antiporter-2